MHPPLLSMDGLDAYRQQTCRRRKQTSIRHNPSLGHPTLRHNDSVLRARLQLHHIAFACRHLQTKQPPAQQQSHLKLMLILMVKQEAHRFPSSIHPILLIPILILIHPRMPLLPAALPLPPPPPQRPPLALQSRPRRPRCCSALTLALTLTLTEEEEARPMMRLEGPTHPAPAPAPAPQKRRLALVQGRRHLPRWCC